MCPPKVGILQEEDCREEKRLLMPGPVPPTSDTESIRCRYLPGLILLLIARTVVLFSLAFPVIIGIVEATILVTPRIRTS